MAEKKSVSALAGRINAGKADPISEEERQIVASLRASYEKRLNTGSNRGKTEGRGRAKIA